ncbi:penicillin-binding protein 2 [Falsarthrobacter nasiphocae]|uniref:Cell division protein FtsI (Penicillin-binding protein 3) n=1 Tax=Falsarthrobacter nasiphocae TaxID=189863 RepID=A0AAE4C6B7_9MICC|nr:penicillin-binding protein 2 [Falsarthrobacter nasiphocae]MDR6891324.1 cell division protein FtsI (penicillin-binding protein 3) [Falsarthrobacter nasiphocae]
MSHGAPLPGSYSRASRTRMQFTIAGFLIVALLLSGRLFWLQILDPADNASKVLKTSVQAIPAQRGEILDTRGRVLAHSVERYDIVVDQTRLRKGGEMRTSFERSVPTSDGKTAKETVTVAQASKEIAKILGIQQQQVQRAVTGTRTFAYVFQGATPKQKDEILAVRMPGVYADERDERQYPMGSVGGSIVGYRNQESSLGGVELMEDKTLQGTPGKRAFQIGRDGIRNPYGTSDLQPAVDGKSVKLTIDADLQAYAQQQIADATSKLNGEWGNAMILDIKTGQILASADNVTVDPNDLSRFKGTAGLQPMGFVNSFEPGSTSKIVTFAAALEEGKITPTTPITTPNRYTIDGETFKDYEDHPTWQRTAAGVLARSLNTGTVQVAAKLTPQQEYDWFRKFGVGQTTGTGFPGEQTGIFRTPDKWDPRQRYTISFGQGYTQTAVQTAQIYQTIANGGVRVSPRLIKSTVDADGTETPAPAAPAERVISEKTAAELNRMMENVTVDGSGQTGALKNYRVAVKTGTAESVGSSGTYDAYTISFAGFAPAEDPKYVVVVTIARTQEITSAQTGPVFARIMERALQQRGVSPSTTKPDLYRTFSDKTPNEGSLSH